MSVSATIILTLTSKISSSLLPLVNFRVVYGTAIVKAASPTSASATSTFKLTMRGLISFSYRPVSAVWFLVIILLAIVYVSVRVGDSSFNIDILVRSSVSIKFLSLAQLSNIIIIVEASWLSAFSFTSSTPSVSVRLIIFFSRGGFVLWLRFGSGLWLSWFSFLITRVVLV